MIAKIGKTKGVGLVLDYCLGEGRGKKLEPGMERRAEVIGGQNFKFEVTDFESADRARQDMESNNTLDRGPPYRPGPHVKRDTHHLMLSWAKHETPDNEHMIETARSALKRLGMERALSVFVRHRDRQHPHIHVVSSRIDPETGRVFSDSWDRHKIQAWSIQHELEHGMVRDIGHRLERAREMTHSLEAKRLEIDRQLDMAEQRMAGMEAEDRAKGLHLPNPFVGTINRALSDDESRLNRSQELDPDSKTVLKQHQRDLGRGREMDVFGFDDGSGYGQSGHGGD